jgi:hypothetical protein
VRGERVTVLRLAMVWGKDDFDSLPVERMSMIAGIGFTCRRANGARQWEKDWSNWLTPNPTKG